MTMRCKRCLLPGGVPGANLDANGICGPCRAYAAADHSLEEKQRLARQADFEQALKECRGKAEFDCLLCLSGGKDSVYLLYKLVKELRLKVLAYTDDFDIPEVAWDNIRRAVKATGAEHAVYKPPADFYKKFIRFLLKNQDSSGAVQTVCYVWASLREGNAVRAAMERRIPLVLAGYSPGQPDPDRMLYEMAPALLHKDWTPAGLKESGLFTEQELSLFWNSRRVPPSPLPRFLAPFHAWTYDQSEVMRKVVEWGLIPSRKRASPIGTNFSMNWLFMYSDLKNLGYNPYAPEFSKLIREGKADRRYWSVMGPVVDFMIRRQVLLGSNVKKSLRWLDLKPEELQIKRTREAVC